MEIQKNIDAIDDSYENDDTHKEYYQDSDNGSEEELDEEEQEFNYFDFVHAFL